MVCKVCVLGRLGLNLWDATKGHHLWDGTPNVGRDLAVRSPFMGWCKVTTYGMHSLPEEKSQR